MSVEAEGRVLVDTNVLVYAFTEGSDPRCGKARDLVLSLMEKNRLCLSTQVLQEFLVTLTRKLGVDWTQALARVEDLAEFRLFMVDKAAILAAGALAARAGLSFWDALIVESARRVGAGVLLTEDLNHGQSIEGVRVTNPFR